MAEEESDDNESGDENLNISGMDPIEQLNKLENPVKDEFESEGDFKEESRRGCRPK